MRRGILALGAATMAGCGPSAQIDYEAAVKQKLRDPQSALFSDVTVNVESACGFVNSKNGYGGYVGRQPFIVVRDEATLIDATAEVSELVNARCLEPTRSQINAWLSDAAIAALQGSR